MAMTAGFLSALDPDEQARLLAGAETRSYEAGEALLVLGCEGNSMFFIQEGEVTVARGEANLAVLGPGSAIGEMALLDPAPRSATVRANGPVTAIELDRATVWGMLADGDSAAVKVLQAITATVCERLSDVNVKVQEEVVRPRGNVFKRLFSSVFGRS